MQVEKIQKYKLHKYRNTDKQITEVQKLNLQDYINTSKKICT